MPSYLITGASRGLGYGFMKVLGEDPRNTVIGLVRDTEAFQKHLEQDGLSHIHIVQADISSFEQLQAAATETKTILNGKGLDVLIHNAAYFTKTGVLKGIREYVDKPEDFAQELNRSIDVNVNGVLKTTFAFLPLVEQGSTKKIVAISSGMADLDHIKDVGLDNGTPLAASKAALNVLIAKLQNSYAEKGLLFLSICPGFVQTDGTSVEESGENAERQKKMFKALNAYAPGTQAMTPEVSAKKCLDAIEHRTLEGGFGGSYMSHNGTKRWI